MKLYKGETGDVSMVMLVWANNLNEAIDICNQNYEDNGDGFEFDNESVEEMIAPDKPGVDTQISFIF
jgi:hypothetical protein